MDYLPLEQQGHKCVVCGADNLLSFIDPALVSSRTSQSNTPVRDKLRCLINHKWFDISDALVLCTSCFNMVERYDQLESEMLQIQVALNSKYANTLVSSKHGEDSKQGSKKMKEEKLEGHQGVNWQPQVSVEFLQPVVNLSSDDDSCEDPLHSSCGSDDHITELDNSTSYPQKKRTRVPVKRQRVELSQKNKSSCSGKSRGRLKRDPHSLTVSFPHDEDPKDTTVFEYDFSHPFFKDGERLRTGQMMIDDVSKTYCIQCIYCTEKKADKKEMNAHAWNTHKPQVITTFVPTEDGFQQSHNFGAQLVKVASESLALGRHFVCIICDSTFKFKSNLLQHFRENHSPHKPFSCVECKAKFRRSIEVSRHRVYYCPNKKSMPGSRNDHNMPPQLD